MAKSHCWPCVSNFRTNQRTLLKLLAMASVASLDPESTTTTSLAHSRLFNVRLMLGSSLNVSTTGVTYAPIPDVLIPTRARADPARHQERQGSRAATRSHLFRRSETIARAFGCWSAS